MRLFGDLFERPYNHLVLRALVERDTVYGGVSGEPDRATVWTTLVGRRTREQLPVDYRLLEKGGRWVVCDVAVDGVSLPLNNRGQFDTIIGTSSYGALVEKIKRRLA